MFTQRNQYHVVLEVSPNLQKNPVSLRQYLSHLFYWQFYTITNIYTNFTKNGPISHYSTRSISSLPHFHLISHPMHRLAMQSMSLIKQKKRLNIPDNVQAGFEGSAKNFKIHWVMKAG